MNKGTIQGKLKLYKDPLLPDQKILMSFKGKSVMPAGYFYAPYLTKYAPMSDPIKIGHAWWRIICFLTLDRSEYHSRRYLVLDGETHHPDYSPRGIVLEKSSGDGVARCEYVIDFHLENAYHAGTTWTKRNQKVYYPRAEAVQPELVFHALSVLL